jgi:hypothetical protein
LRSKKTTGSFSRNGPRKAFGFTMNDETSYTAAVT